MYQLYDWSLFLIDIISVKGVDAEEDCGWAYSTYHSLG